MHPTVQFKAKVETVYNVDDTPAWRFVKVPKLERRHCDMPAFRASKRFSSYANSDLFPSMLARAVQALGVKNGAIRLDQVPAGVTIDESGFLAVVNISLTGEV